MKAKRVLVAMSGGVDSSVAAYLLKKEGYDVLGATIQTWAPKDCDKLNTRACCSVEGVEDARGVAAKIGIPYYVFNMEKEFKSAVVDYFTSEYLAGRTPNPCLACNEKIKFKLFRRRALALGVDAMATGHYAEVVREEASGRYYIKEGVDKSKDQSYVLYGLAQEELASLRLPLGPYRKDEIRALAKEAGLRVFDKPDSQEICFIPSNDYATFLKKELSIDDQQGLIKTQEGKILGEHPGYFHFTIGQRKGLGVASPHPLYVIRIDKEKNELIVGSKEEVKSQRFRVKQLNWMMPINGVRQWRFKVKIRSNHKKSEAAVRLLEGGEADVAFELPQEAVTPGQAAVFYDSDTVMGGGRIDSLIGE